MFVLDLDETFTLPRLSSPTLNESLYTGGVALRYDIRGGGLGFRGGGCGRSSIIVLSVGIF